MVFDVGIAQGKKLEKAGARKIKKLD